MRKTIEEKSYDGKSWFKAGRIIQCICQNEDKNVIEFGIGGNENVFEIYEIVRKYTARHINLVPLRHGFSMRLTNGKVNTVTFHKLIEKTLKAKELEIDSLKKERDAAIEDMERVLNDYPVVRCGICKYEGDMNNCKYGRTCFKWRYS